MIGISKYLILALTGSLVLGLAKSGNNAFLYIGIFGLGLTSAGLVVIGIKKTISSHQNILLKLFIVLASLGVGFVILIATLFAAIFADISRDPDTLQCG